VADGLDAADNLISVETRHVTPKSDHPDPGYAALKAQADAVYTKNADALKAQQIAVSKPEKKAGK
jgi:hypothetical protein